MYDELTAEFIKTAPQLEGLDADQLPKMLAEAFAEVVRIRLDLVQEEVDDGQSTALLNRLRRLAATYETYTILIPERNDAKAAAYVAGTAHSLLQDAENRPKHTILDIHGFSSDISSTLLFIIAGYFADAAESAKKIGFDEFQQVSEELSALVAALNLLGRGNFGEILNIDLLSMASDAEVSDYVWRELTHGIQGLAGALIGTSSSELGLPEDFESVAWFDRIAQLTYSTESGPDAFSSVHYTMAGPHQLALLLREAAGSLLQHSVLKTPPPTGDVSAEWEEFLHQTAKRRPLLWPNHLAAVEEGFHKNGVSSVVTFPTGAGKSTIVEMKIAGALVSGRSVVYLAPTHSLVGQIASNIRKSFPERTVRNSSIREGFYAEVDDRTLPDVFVATPERCLTLLSVYPEMFAGTGLIVFDECHLIHPRDISDRRALDATLCLLHLLRTTDQPDVTLVSAMVKNAQELANWISEITASECRVLDYPWKPTRQARGCVVYLREEIEELSNALRNARKTASTKTPPVALKRRLKATPFGLFSLRYHWNQNASDFRRLGLLDSDVPLTANRYWQLTANRNEVAAHLAKKFARCEMRTLVFAQQVRWAESAAKSAGDMLEDAGIGEVEFNDEEDYWYRMAIEELGGEEHVVLPMNGRAAVHHGLLLDAERRLSESLFSREDGARILVATPTLAQGMNLPADVVIIGGDDRFDQEADSLKSLEAHELLNAAGRAGRAGFASHGLVLVVPGVVVGLEPEDRQLSERWFDLQKRIFSKSDQCLKVEDPVELLLDEIDAGGNEPELTKYLSHRIPLDNEDPEDGLLSASLAAFHARQDNEETKFRSRVRQLRNIKEESLSHDEDVDAIATALGAPPTLIWSLQKSTARISEEARTVSDVVKCFGKWLRQTPEAIDELLDRQKLQRITKKVDGVDSDRERVKVLVSGCLMWMQGAPLRDIEAMLGTEKEKLKTCKQARKLTQRLIRGISYGVGWIALIERIRRGEDSMVPLYISSAGACVRGGFDCPEKLAIGMSMPKIGRVAAHRFFDQNRQLFPDATTIGSLEPLYERVRLLKEQSWNFEFD